MRPDDPRDDPRRYWRADLPDVPEMTCAEKAWMIATVAILGAALAVFFINFVIH